MDDEEVEANLDLKKTMQELVDEHGYAAVRKQLLFIGIALVAEDKPSTVRTLPVSVPPRID